VIIFVIGFRFPSSESELQIYVNYEQFVVSVLSGKGFCPFVGSVGKADTFHTLFFGLATGKPFPDQVSTEPF
jgi:hypothetical protein